jgi:hypothetical protein
MKNELEMLTEVKEFKQNCTSDHYILDEKSSVCFTPDLSCDECIFEGRYRTEPNKRLQELISIISLEDT